MARPPLPATGATGWQDILNAAIDDVSDRADSALAQTASGVPGCVLLDSFTGATDDAKLTAARSYAAAQTYPPTILLTNRKYFFTSPINGLYRGFRLRGPSMGISNPELAAASKGCEVDVNLSGTWLNVTGGDAWDCFVGGITFTGHSAATFLGTGDGSSLWHCSHLRDVSFTGFKTVLGTQAAPLKMVASVIDGWFDINGTYNGGMHIAGTDCRLFTNGGLIDSGVSFHPGGANQYHLWCDSMDYTTIGPLYITAEGPWGGIRVSGAAYNGSGQTSSSNTGQVSMQGLVVMGRNQNAPCYGSLVRVDGGLLKMRDSIVTFGLSNPSTAAMSPIDAGVIMVTGSGAALLDGITFDRYAGQAETVPMLYTSSAGPTRIANAYINSRGGVWTGLPRVHNAGTGTFKTDDTVTVA